jgi:hypothetical protein
MESVARAAPSTRVYVRGVAIVRGLVVAADERDEMARPGGCSDRCGTRHFSGAVGPSRVLGRVALGVGRNGSVSARGGALREEARRRSSMSSVSEGKR